MDNESENGELVWSRFHELCLAVNMDKPTKELAWQSYERIIMNYTLEGDCLHWLVCALYSSCKRNLSSAPGQMHSSNCISLTMLLREAKFSLISFFRKMRKWLEMDSSAGSPLVHHIEALEKSFRVSTVVFKKFLLVFKCVFADPDDPANQKASKGSFKNPPRPHRTRRNRQPTCTSKDIFKFCWTLFIHAKGTAYRSISGELVSSFQLLLSGVDLCFKNALHCTNREALLNPEFEGLPDNWKDKTADLSENTDIITLLVQKFAASGLTHLETEQFLLETRVVNIHNWKKYVSSLLDPEKELLRGDETTMFIPQCFEANRKAINKLYEEFVLTEGDFDERVFLCDDVDNELGTPIKNPPPNPPTISSQFRKEINDHLADPDSLAPKTPLTNREFLKGKREETKNSSPVSTALHSVAKLKKLLHGKPAGPSDKLLLIFKECTENPANEIRIRVEKLGDEFIKCYTKPYKNFPASSEECAEDRLNLSKVLYFHTLEATMLQERKRLGKKSELISLLKRDDFHNLLFACCAEIVLCSYESRRVFPWIMDALDLTPYYFYKVIELIIRAEDNLSGPCVKHLNHIEEQILESMAWTSHSPLWLALEQSNWEAPLCEEVNHSHHIEPSSSNGVLQSGKSPLTHPRIKAVAGDPVGSHRKSDAGTVGDRFSSPAPGSAKRRLFGGEHGRLNAEGNSFPKTHIVFPASSGQKSIVLNSNDAESGNEKIEKPKKTGSLALFFRKVYHMTSVRLRHLCDQLVISPDLQAKIWTCFEHSLSKHCQKLMRDRHVDQLLMCAVYVMAKITQHDQSFQEIMRCYRTQPQATSNVYRNVLIKRASSPNLPNGGTSMRSNSTVPAPQPSSLPPSPTPNPPALEERHDLITFYNKVYLPTIREFVKKFTPSGEIQHLEVPLSPMPRIREILQSPRKVPGNNNISISPMKPHLLVPSSPNTIEYNFQRSPSKHLRDINKMVLQHGGATKRFLAFDSDEATQAKRPAVTSRVQLLHDQRNGVN